MFPDEAINALKSAIREQVSRRLGSLRLMPEAEEELALVMLNALREAGFEVADRKQ